MTDARERFQYWLAEMDDVLEELAATEWAAADLDFGVESLDRLEKLILARFDDRNPASAQDQSRAVDALARYVGETFRRNCPGSWQLQEEPELAFAGLAVIRDPVGTYCPLALVNTATLRRNGIFLSGLLRSRMARASKA